ncbi:MAG: dynamin family protein [Desulfobacterales bacterium]|nr:dynamin family protein [Desulfobacterales bacterium]
MKNDYNGIKKELLALTEDFRKLYIAAHHQDGMMEAAVRKNQAACEAISRQLNENTLRIAAVGPIKSGKSSFVNSILGGDYLKRGAGVVTSFVTRVRFGAALSARLVFKTWSEISEDIEQALVLFPTLDWHTEKGAFDVRHAKEREALARSLAALSPEQLVSRDARNANSVVLASFLKGYDRVQGLIDASPAVIHFDASRFAEHRDFAGNDDLAVYLKDIQLEIPSPHLESHLEIADCQGSDSPNPLHLAMIQDYLLETHFIVYVISSRTGLRRADIKFLSIIKKMGILDNILFVFNIDFSEHDNLDDLKQLKRKVAEELAILRPDPEIYSFSVLFNLFRNGAASLPEKERLRLEQWQADEALVAYSDKESARFQNDLQDKLMNESSVLLLRNHVERLLVMGADMGRLIKMKQELLKADEDRAAEIVKRIGANRQRMAQIRGVIKNTLEGGIHKLRKELRVDVDRFFDPHSTDIMRRMIDFVRSYSVPVWQEHIDNLATSGFANTLYHVYQEFKQALDGFIAESINPEIFRFIRDRERRLVEYLHTVAEPYSVMVEEAVAEFQSTADGLGIDAMPGAIASRSRLPGLEVIRQTSRLQLPPANAAMRYSAKVKTEAIMRLGAYKFLRGFRKLLRKPADSGQGEEMRALQDGVERMKRETERSLLFHFKDYRENIKFGYIFKMVESASVQITDGLLERFEIYESDLAQMVALIDESQAVKTEQEASFREIAANADLLYQHGLRLRDRVLAA